MNRLVRRIADGEFDGLFAAAIFGLAMGTLFAVSVLLESQP